MTTIDLSALESCLHALLSYPSPQPDLEAVRALIARVVQPMISEAGFDRVVLDSTGNLVAQRFGSDHSLRPLVWYTYGATYPAAGMRDPYPAQRLEAAGRPVLRGRGAAEQRTGLAAVIEAVRALARRGRPRRGYTFITCVAGEMGNHHIAEALVQQHGLQAGGIVLAVATQGQIGIGNLGRVDIHVEVEGRPCHSSDPSRGVNAVDGAVAFCQRLKCLPPLPADPDLGQATLAITGIVSDPLAPHTIPARCRVTLDRRLVPGEHPETATAQVAACAEGIEPQIVKVSAGHSNLPGKLPPDHPLARLAKQAALQVGQDAPYFYRRAALDAGYFLSLGMPAIMWGPGDPRLAHQDEERVDLADALAGASAYLVLTELCCWTQPDQLDHSEVAPNV